MSSSSFENKTKPLSRHRSEEQALVSTEMTQIPSWAFFYLFLRVHFQVRVLCDNYKRADGFGECNEWMLSIHPHDTII